MAIFGLGKNLAVLESKFEIYEDVSKEMLDKLDRAVNTISENSNRVAVILERHEGKLEESARTDQIIIEMINDLKEQNTNCLLYTSPSPRDATLSRMPSSA